MKTTKALDCLLWLTLVTLAAYGQPCEPGKPTKLKNVAIVSRSGTASLIGFPELKPSGDKPRKFRRRDVTGTMMWLKQAEQCETTGNPGDYAADATGLIIPGIPGAVSYAASLEPVGTGPDGRIAYRAAVSATIGNDAAGVRILAGGAIAGNIDDVAFADGETKYLDPASAPYDVLVQVAYVFWQPVPGSGARMLDSPRLQYRDEWDIHQEFAADDPQGLALLDNRDRSTRFEGWSANFPLESGGVAKGKPATTDCFPMVGEQVGPSQRLLVGDGQCVNFGTGDSGRALGDYEETLSVEDTEEQALRRALSHCVVGATPHAFRGSRSHGYSFDFSDLQLVVPLQIECEGEYQVLLHFTARPTNGAPERHFSWVVGRHFSAGAHEMTGRLDIERMTISIDGAVTGVGAGARLEYDTEYRFEGAELQTGCPGDAAGSMRAWQGSVHLRFSSGGGSGAELALDAEEIGPELFNPGGLRVAVPTLEGYSIALDASGFVRQLRSPAGMADVVVTGPEEYEIRYYGSGAVGEVDSGTGIAEVKGDPFVTYRIGRARAIGDALQGLRVARVRGGQEVEYEYLQDRTARIWTFRSGNGLRTETAISSPTEGGRRETVEVSAPDGTAVSKTERRFMAFPWGEELVAEIKDPDGQGIAEEWQFISNPDEPGYGQVRARSSGSGSWSRYSYDERGRRVKVVRPFLSSAPNSTEAEAEVLETTYASLPDADGDGLDEELRIEIDRTLGQETARRYEIDWSSGGAGDAPRWMRQTRMICTVAGSNWDDERNLRTETLRYAEGRWAGREHWVLRPDGTATMTTYAEDASGNAVETIEEGAPGQMGLGIAFGTRTVVYRNAAGFVVSRSVTDLETGWRLGSSTATAFDETGRPTRINHDDGTFELAEYSCCGVASTQDRAGSRARYAYDELGRQVEMTVAGISTTQVIDAEGRLLETWQVGDDGTKLLLVRREYDLSGQITGEWGPDGQFTGYERLVDPIAGRLYLVTTKADGSTEERVLARDGNTLSISGTATEPRSFEYGVAENRRWTKEIKLGEGGSRHEWIATYKDLAGRTSTVVYPDGAAASRRFNSRGQLVAETDPDGVTVLYSYGALGEVERAAVDMNRNGEIDLDGSDRITSIRSEVVRREGKTANRTVTGVWDRIGDDEPVVISIHDETFDGAKSWTSLVGVAGEETSELVRHGEGLVSLIVTGVDGSREERFLQDGRLVRVVRLGGDERTEETLLYDAFRRLSRVVDSRYGDTDYEYFSSGGLHAVTSPDPDPSRTGLGYDRQTTRFEYDVLGRLLKKELPDGGLVNYSYWPTGRLKRTWGARVHPVDYRYDPQGRMTEMTTWADAGQEAGAATTKWLYDPGRGWLSRKLYADGEGPAYSYTPAGRIRVRESARRIAANYEYNAAGDLSAVTYSDVTPAVNYERDRLGRLAAVGDGTGFLALRYAANGNLDREYHPQGLLHGHALEWAYDGFGRPVTMLHNGSVAADFSYDSWSRLAGVQSGALTASYAYPVGEQRPSRLEIWNGSALRLTVEHDRDHLGRLSTLRSSPGAGIPIGVLLERDAAGLIREAVDLAGSNSILSRDSLGQLISVQRFSPEGAPSMHLQEAWSYDVMGNRRTETLPRYGAEFTAHYESSSLNQYLSRGVDNTVDLLARASSGSIVSFQYPAGAGLPVRLTEVAGEYRGKLTVDNQGRAVWLPLIFAGVKPNAGPGGEDIVAEVERGVLVPSHPEEFSHDADGNLIRDGKWEYTWDAENRLTAVQTRSDLMAPAGPLPESQWRRLVFAYDYMGRRISKEDCQWVSGGWKPHAERRFLYDGWNLVAEIDGTTGGVIARHTWGLDVGGAVDGGGVGALLFSTSTAASGSPEVSFAPAFDACGNCCGLVDLSSGEWRAQWLHSAFGKQLVAEGALADRNPFGFATKYTDRETGLIYFGHRYLNPSTGRWLSRDPLGEPAGANLYAYADNSPYDWTDPLGLALYAFDGTQNDGFRDQKTHEETNVFILYNSYRGNASYSPGVGTNDGLLNPFGSAFGAGGQSRVERMIARAEEFYSAGDAVADIIGFSRGAAQARDFANRLRDKLPCVKIRWMGLFDTVASTGVPNDVNLGYQLGIPADVGSVLHLTAGGERRSSTFALTSIKRGPRLGTGNKAFREVEIPEAVHSDVGGGYPDNRGLANQALQQMWSDGIRNSVPFGPLDSRYSSTGGVPHDSRWANDRLVEFFTNQKRVRQVYYHP